MNADALRDQLSQIEDLLQRLYQQASDGEIQNALEDIQHQLATAQHLSQEWQQYNTAVEALYASLEPSKVSQAALVGLQTLSQSQTAYLFRRYPESERIEVVLGLNSDGELMGEYRRDVNEDMLQFLIEKRESTYVPIAEIMSPNASPQIDIGYVIPIVYRKRLMGACYLEFTEDSVVEDEARLALLDTFAEHIGQAISQSRQFDQVRTYLKETQEELIRLSIEIDEEAVEDKVNQVTESEIFGKLRSLKKKDK